MKSNEQTRRVVRGQEETRSIRQGNDGISQGNDGISQDSEDKSFAKELFSYASKVSMDKIDNDKHISVFIPSDAYEYCRKHRLPYNKLILLGIAYHKAVGGRAQQEQARKT